MTVVQSLAHVPPCRQVVVAVVRELLAQIVDLV
jgi:hypothetical protein